MPDQYIRCPQHVICREKLQWLCIDLWAVYPDAMPSGQSLHENDRVSPAVEPISISSRPLWRSYPAASSLMTLPGHERAEDLIGLSDGTRRRGTVLPAASNVA